ncbi:TPA: trypsin-like peptidase domain-containing protein [Klebsiella pneumoniae]|uniref:S1 family peptidase n=1 Tax=Klebsiella TaxID=570 RepID=UPI000CDD1BFD|nr:MULTISPECIES: serine protease [Klebsiella]MDK7836804.1 serine protease [Klebsiella pneumoniae]POT70474.1 serine protease [Klebsiella michiganensis]HEI9837890.1 trypsin-like peptidase domain-containing protein [Klebsiella pneumoniae]
MSDFLADNIIKATVMISCDNNSTGTGFFYCLKNNKGEIVPFIITNKHVVKGAKIAEFIVRAQNVVTGEVFKKLPIMISDIDKGIEFHPEKDVDLCAFPLGPLLHELSKKNLTIDYYPFNSDNLFDKYEDKDSFTAIEDVFMTGYPRGIWDRVNNKPITRKGITATDYKENWEGKTEFVIDIACYPGSSGSPVYVYNNGPFLLKGKPVVGQRLILLGILYGGIEYSANGELKVVEVPTAQTVIPITKMSLNIGVVIKSEKLDYLKDVVRRLTEDSQ